MLFRIRVDRASGQRYMAVSRRGRALLINPSTNKGTAFTAEERRDLGLDGLLPRAISTMEQQLERCYEHFGAKTTDLERFIYLTALQDRNETLFFRLLHEHIDEMMPIVYTPVVGRACQEFSHIYRRARGLYLGCDGRSDVGRSLANHHRTPSIIVVTDGERILGLGDQGAGGMAIPIGKLCLYTLCAGVSPYETLPVLLDVGTDNEERLADPLYLGLRHRRIRGAEYQSFVDAFVGAVSGVWPDVLLQFEDFLKGNAIAQLARFRDEICCFNDDIQGTAAVTLAGIYAALRVTGQRLTEQRVVLAGAGAAASGIAELIVKAMVDSGLSQADATARIWTVDTRGLVHAGRTGLEAFKARFARPQAEAAAMSDDASGAVGLADVVAAVKPTILIGTSAVAGLFSEPMIRSMAAHVDRPIVFPLSNPTSKIECAPERVLAWSDGRALVATGSPFPPFELAGRVRRIGQCNNAFIFPGVGLGVCAARIRRITDRMFLDAARALAAQVGHDDLETGALFPPLSRIREVSHAVACAVIRAAVEAGHAEPEMLDDLEHRVSVQMWRPEYLPIRYQP